MTVLAQSHVKTMHTIHGNLNYKVYIYYIELHIVLHLNKYNVINDNVVVS